jgi:PEP-CTERM motif-containing protein
MLRSLRVLVVSAALFVAFAATASAASILIGAPATGGNCFPFECAPFGGNLGNRYQQVYAASDFSGLFTITGVTFFDSLFPGATFTDAVYTVTLSTTAKAVNGLDLANMNNNVGGDNTMLFSGHRSGATGVSFTLSGGLFLYNPGSGNLLLDIQMSNIGARGAGALDARIGDSGGLFSRAHNFDGGFDNFGLVTQFEGVAATVPEPATLTLLGTGIFALARRTRARRSRSA